MPLNAELWLERFRQWLQLRNSSLHTIAAYSEGLRQFFLYLDSQGIDQLSAITRDVVEGYRGQLFQRRYRNKPLSFSTQSNRLQAVKAFLRYLFKEHFLLWDVGAAIELPKKHQALPRILSEDEVLRLLNAVDVQDLVGLRDRAMLEVFYSCAIRNGELAALAMADVDWERKALWIRQGKGGKDRLVPMGEEALAWLEEYLTRTRPQLLRDPQEHRVFLNRNGGVLTREAVLTVVHRYADKAGLKGVRTHTLRHSCATHMLARGAGLRHLQAMLGHSSPVTTELYTQVELTDLHKVLRRCHPREKQFGR